MHLSGWEMHKRIMWALCNVNQKWGPSGYKEWVYIYIYARFLHRLVLVSGFGFHRFM